MSTIIRDKTNGYRRVVGFPNELTDGQPGSFVQGEQFLFKYDPACQGLYCQKCPEHWLVRILDALDRSEDRRCANKTQLQFDNELFKPQGQSQLQIEMCQKLHHLRHGSNLMRWVENEPDDDTRRINNILAWRADRPSRGRLLTDPHIDSILRYRIEEDPDFFEEVLRGDWD